MTSPIIIIGSGFAAYQLIKTIRRSDSLIPIQVFTADDGAEYNKPDLSHVVSKQQTAADLVIKSGEMFAKENNISLFTHTTVEAIDTKAQQIRANGCDYPYAKLVFATGAKAFIPPMKGNAIEKIVTLNSRQEYQQAENQITHAKHILVIGGGLIGVEIAMDMANSGKKITLVEPNQHLLANLLPDFVAQPLENRLTQQGITLALNSSVKAINAAAQRLAITLSNNDELVVDAVISAAGLRANIALAKDAGITVNRGIAVDQQLASSEKNVFALGDCAEIQGRLMPYLQPIVLSANVLAKQLLQQEAQLKIPPIMVKVKTPSYPIQLAGNFEQTSTWNVQFTEAGIIAKASNNNNQLIGFIVTEGHISHAFPLLRELSLSIANIND